MTTFRLKITDACFEEIERLVFAVSPKEAAAFALAGVARLRDTTDILVRRAVEVPTDQYDHQDEYHLRVAPRAINGLLALCEANGLGAVICHSHPDDIPYSPSDDLGEKRIVDTLTDFIPAGAPTVSLLFTPAGTYGRVWLRGSPAPVPLSEILIIGRAMRRIHLTDQLADQPASEIYNRQVRALGEDGHALIARAKVGVVGVGGTGSPTAEQLVRLGVRDFVLIDPDVYEESNITRVYGSFASTARRRFPFLSTRQRNKVDVVAEHLHNINPNAAIKAVAMNVAEDDAARQLLDRDVIFLCTDELWGRSVVNRLAYQYLIPTINVGVRISAADDEGSDGRGVVDILRPDLPCLWCKGTLNADRIAAESMPSSDRERLAAEGYIQGLEDPAPSVVSFTTTLSALAVSHFLQIVTDFMGEAGNISRLNYDILQSTVRRGTTPILERCVCQKICAFGDLTGRGTVVADRSPP